MRKEFAQTLEEASNRVSNWPEWKRSSDVRAELEKLAKQQASNTNQVKVSTKARKR